MLTKLLLTSFVLLGFFVPAKSQQLSRQQDIDYSTTLVRSVDLDWKTNKDYFGEDKVFIRILIQALHDNKIAAYADKNFQKKFDQHASLYLSSEVEEDSFQADKVLNPYFHEFEITEELIFNKHYSNHYFNIKSISIINSRDINPHGIDEVLCYFKFEDCVRLFLNDAKAYTEKRLINGRKVNYGDLLIIKGFYNEIVKIGNEEDLYYDQKYSDPQLAFLASKHDQELLVEYLYKLYNMR